MDYFSPRTPAAAYGDGNGGRASSYADRAPGGAGAASSKHGRPSADYFSTVAEGDVREEGAEKDPGAGADADAATTATGGGGASEETAASGNKQQSSTAAAAFPTANPFKLANAHPTAFPVQNGASAGFQQALLQRQSSMGGHDLNAIKEGSATPFFQLPLATPLRMSDGSAGAEKRKASNASTSAQPPLSMKRHNAPHSVQLPPKSPRTPSISSPRKMESVSPPSSPDHHPAPRHRMPSFTSQRQQHPKPSLAGNDMFKMALAGGGGTSIVPQTPSIHQSQTNPFQPPTGPVTGLPVSFLAHRAPLGASATLPYPLAGGAIAGGAAGGASLRQSASLASFKGSSATGPSAFGSTAAGARRAAAVQNPRFKGIGTSSPELPTILAEASRSQSARGALGSEDGDGSIVIDLRTHTAFVTQGRIHGAVNICVPSTLLRRPNFSLAKIAETIPGRKDRRLFTRAAGLPAEDGASASVIKEQSKPSDRTKILVLDQELNTLTTESVVHSLLSKLEKADFPGELYWLRGGWNALDKLLCSAESAEGEGGASQQSEDELNAFIDWDTLYEASEDEEEDTDGMEDADDRMQGVQATGAAGPTGPTMALRMPTGSAPIPLGHASRSSAAAEAGTNAQEGSSGRSSTSSFASSSADSLLPSSYASSRSSVEMSSAHGQQLSTSGSSSSLGAFDRSKLALPDFRRPASPACDSSSAASTETEGPAGSGTTSSSTGTSGSKSSTKGPVIRPRNLPMSAFQFGSTAAFGAAGDDVRPHRRGGGGSQPNSRPSSSAGPQKEAPVKKLADASGQEGKSEYPSVSSKGELRIGRGGNAGGARRAAANPFFDNIRQNIESASLEQTLAHVAPLQLPEQLTRPELRAHLPRFLQTLVDLTPRSRSEKLHREYYDVEQNEQKRLQKVLDWHCTQSAVVEIGSEGSSSAKGKNGKAVDSAKSPKQQQAIDTSKASYHPFSISAGVEKGHLNRYKNMWPYEHARVRLAGLDSETCGDYINASHIRLRGTKKNYIASQGPMGTTTEHFWKLVLQENVDVIVMLTLLSEGGREKCSNYFKTGEYGSISLRVLEEIGDKDTIRSSVNEEVGFFAQGEASLPTKSEAGATPDSAKEEYYTMTAEQQREKTAETTVVRKIEVRRLASQEPPRVVTHIQYIDWPDFDIPPDPRCVLGLITVTSDVQREHHSEEAPVLVHCSAGVGRTGTFIAVDTLLERYRKQRQGEAPPSPPASTARSPVTSPSARASEDRRSSSKRDGGKDSGGSSRAQRAGSNSESMSRMTLTSPITPGNRKWAQTAESSPEPDNRRFAAAPSSSSSPPLGTGKLHRPSLPHRRTDSSDGSRSGGGSKAALIAHLKQTELTAQDNSDPIRALVDQMREQRMSSVANAGQYVFIHQALLAGIAAELEEEGVLRV